jgi:Antidote-toxin recognition MazE, bacterial antitoxin
MSGITESKGIEERAIRRVQALTGERSLTVVLPKNFVSGLGITKGDFLIVHVENSRLILEKAEL